MNDDIKIRHAEKRDALSMRDLYSQPHIIEGTGDLPYPSLELWEKRSEEWGKGNSIFLVAESNCKVIGQLNISINKSVHRKHAAGMGLVVDAHFLNKGVGTLLMKTGIELADRWLNIKRLELSVYCDNEPALKLYKKFGFEVEGRMKAFAFRNGQFVDALRMARITPFSTDKN